MSTSILPKDVTITDSFWRKYHQLIKEEVIPYQYDVMNDSAGITIEKERKEDSLPNEKSHVLENLRIAAGLTKGHHYGWWFQDSDAYKWIETVAYDLMNGEHEEIEELADNVIELIAKAQDRSGYLSTFYQIDHPELKYRCLYQSHELYCAGHLIEAAVAYKQATGKNKLLKIAEKFVDDIADHFGKEPGKIHGADGHQEIELALAKLYEETGNNQYLELASFFLEVRGKDPDFYRRQTQKNVAEGLEDKEISIDLNYLQGYAPPRSQKTAEGHAVRMLYMCQGMADVAYYTEDKELFAACEKIWDNIVKRKMYITGGVGSTVSGEAFTGDYDLPNDTMYCETCAAVGMVNFAASMYRNDPDVKYTDVLERALYNGVLAGMALDGKHFFYVNPLEVEPDSCHHNPGKGHVKTVRPEWLGCACCPPNFTRTISALGRYIYTKNIQTKTLAVHLFAASTVNVDFDHEFFQIEQKSHFPFSKKVSLTYRSQKKNSFNLSIRSPNWSQRFVVKLNGELADAEFAKGYFNIQREWKDEDEVTFELDPAILTITSHPKVQADAGKMALQYGPFVYCAESIDNGSNLSQYSVSPYASKKMVVKKSDLGELNLIQIEASKRKESEAWQDKLYRFDHLEEEIKETLTLIPYFAWGNRGENEMTVWLKKK